MTSGVKARLLLEMKFEDGTERIVEVHKLAAGPKINYFDAETGQTRATGISYSEYTEHKDDGERHPTDYVTQKVLKDPDREFIEVHIMAQMLPAELGETMRIIYPDKLDGSVTPHSLLLGRQTDDS